MGIDGRGLNKHGEGYESLSYTRCYQQSGTTLTVGHKNLHTSCHIQPLHKNHQHKVFPSSMASILPLLWRKHTWNGGTRVGRAQGSRARSFKVEIADVPDLLERYICNASVWIGITLKAHVTGSPLLWQIWTPASFLTHT